MKNFLGKFFICAWITFSVNTLACDPLLVVILMVKNEAISMQMTLEPYLKAGMDSFLILDTGSTDNTIAITKELFEQHKVKNGYIEEQPFVDFATSRNYAIACAEKRFPEADFFLMIDAEWYLHNVKGLLRFCEEQKKGQSKAFSVRMINPGMDFCQARLFRARCNVRFVGAVHEVLNEYSRVCAPSDTYFEYRTTEQGREKTRIRWLRDRDLLLKEYAKDPDAPRTTFYLAQTYDCLDDVENACIYYKLRTALEGWDEENFITRYRLGQVYERRGMWDLALRYYLEAFTLRPTRAEPLVRIASYYLWKKNYTVSFLFAQPAAAIKYPKTDVLFIEKDLYDFTRFDVLGQSAWYVGEFALGEAAVRKALEARPDMEHLLGNLALYESNRRKLLGEKPSF